MAPRVTALVITTGVGQSKPEKTVYLTVKNTPWRARLS